MITNSIRTPSFILLACLAGTAGASTIDIPLVTVGDPGNVADPATGYGAVPYTFAIGEFDITIAEYTAFLNAVATLDNDPYRLYDSRMENYGGPFGIDRSGGYIVRGNGAMPATWVFWADAARFTNWLANGQPTKPEGPGTTETGTYNLNGALTDAALMAVTRNPGSTWVIPTVDEWYKSAYYVGGGTNAGYWTYATQSNTLPSNVLSATGTNNANFFDVNNIVPPNNGFTNPATDLTPVGSFAASPSAYGTYDQTGDVWEWNETAYYNSLRGLRGGGYGDSSGGLTSGFDDNSSPTGAGFDIGFRVAYVPEPGTVALLIAAAVAGIFFLRR